jgi:Mrp family chromosome partitioning ATPase
LEKVGVPIIEFRKIWRHICTNCISSGNIFGEGGGKQNGERLQHRKKCSACYHWISQNCEMADSGKLSKPNLMGRSQKI